MQANNDFYTIVELAARLRVSRDTIDRWVKGGLIAVVRLPSGHYRIPLAEVERLCAANIAPSGLKSGESNEASA
jgi:excisionase family DNA binding protein